MDDSFVDGMMGELCKSQRGFKFIFVLSVVGIGIMALWLPFVRLDSGTGAIVVLNILLSLGFASFSGFFLWRCAVRSRN